MGDRRVSHTNITKKMMNKKGATLTIGMVMALFVGIILIIFLSSGGAVLAFDITRFLKTIPAPVWVIFGIIALFKLRGKKR